MIETELAAIRMLLQHMNKTLERMLKELKERKPYK